MKIVVNNQKIFRYLDKLIGYQRFVEYHEIILVTLLIVTAVSATLNFYLAGFFLWLSVVLKAIGYEHSLLSEEEEQNNKRNPLNFFKKKWVQKALNMRVDTLSEPEYLKLQKRNIYLTFWLLSLFLTVMAVTDILRI